ncbi:M16 family metallopeptidase [Nonomuraea sp. NPDC003707]
MVTPAGRTPPARRAPRSGPERELRMPDITDVVLANGLRMLAVRAPSVPLVEIRLRVPLPGTTPEPDAATRILSSLILRRSMSRAPEAVADVLGRAGASLQSAGDERWLGVSGTAAAPMTHAVLEVLFDLLTSPDYRDDEVASERRRAVGKAAIELGHPQVLARQALRKHLHGDSVRLVPSGEALSAVTATQVRELHERAVQPRGALLVLVGDLDGGRLAGELRDLASAWRPAAVAPRRGYRPPLVGSGIELVDRPGAVQSQIVLAAPAPARTDPRFPALEVANALVGGYFSARLVGRLREELGLAYRLNSRFEEFHDDVSALIEVGTATEATSTTLGELHVELARLAEGDLTSAEIDGARRHMVGMTDIGLSSQAALATALSNAVGFGHEPHWLVSYPRALREVTAADVCAAVADFYQPPQFTGVVVGDGARLSGILDA